MGKKKAIHLGEQYYSLMRSLKRSSYSEETVEVIENLAKNIYEVSDEERTKYFKGSFKGVVLNDFLSTSGMLQCFIPIERGTCKMEVEIAYIKRIYSIKDTSIWSITIKNNTVEGHVQYQNMHTVITYHNYRSKKTKVCKIPWRKSGLHLVK
jgi:hypothetical protein